MLEIVKCGRAHNFRHFFYGGGTGVAQRLAEHFVAAYPGVAVAGAYSPPYRPLTADEDIKVVELINGADPDIVWVGLGTGKQEKWMASHVGRINAAALFGIGAAFDFHSGRVPWAPEWIRRSGLEWAYRLVHEPRRLWRRNLDSPVFLAAVIAQRIGMVLNGVSARTLP
jgi:N-acetylglucosaminyldiphosphoundecaprenol N-acetyl-beta-D-mannosaminyltransferase